MTEEQLQAIRRRCEAATPGPWAAYNAGRGHYGVLAAGSGTVLMTQDRESARADIQFAAYARRDVPQLLSEVERLRGLLRQAYEVVLWQARTDAELRPVADAMEQVLGVQR